MRHETPSTFQSCIHLSTKIIKVYFFLRDKKLRAKYAKKQTIDSAKWKPGEALRNSRREKESDEENDKENRGRESRKDKVMAFRKIRPSPPLIMDKTIINSTGEPLQTL